ncbi:MAG: hypothetical protein K5984_00395 [Bacteroidales bacterium]|nr:hypothetical protein [Bacteroidales bacterium]
MADTTFEQLGRVEAIRQLFEGSSFRAFEEPLAFTAKASDVIVNVNKTLLEGMDFDLVYFPLKHLGYKAVVMATGEIYAAMAHPKTLSVTLSVSAKLDFKHISELWSGVVSAAKEFGYESLGLDLQPSKNGLVVCVNATGAASKITAARRPKPLSKDLVCVSGALGAAYLGMQVLERERVKFENGANDQKALEQYKMLVGSYLKPELSSKVVGALEDDQIYPSKGYFVTKGLSDTVKKLSRDTGLGVKIYADKIPFEGNSFALGKELDIDPVSAAMNGGDDCRLLFTIPILQLEKFRRDFQTFDIIGHLAQPEVGTVLVTPDGVELPMKAQGWAEE